MVRQKYHSLEILRRLKILKQKKWSLDGEAQRAFVTIFGSLYVSGKLLTYPYPKPTFCPKWKVSVNVRLGKG